MMFSILVDWLNRRKLIQYCFCFFPCFVIILYCIVLTFSVSDILAVLSNNDAITERDSSYNLIKEVDSFKVNDTGSYDVVVSGSGSETVDIKYGDIIYSVVYLDEDYYQIAVSNGAVLYTAHTDLDKGGSHEYGDIIAEVYLNEDNKFRVVYMDESEEFFDTLNSVDVLLEIDQGCRFDINAGYNIELNDAEINFCTSLPTDGLYYNENTLSLVRNIDSSFKWMFLSKMNCWIILCMMLMYSFILYAIPRRSELSVLGVNRNLVCNFVAYMVLLFHVWLAAFLL